MAARPVTCSQSNALEQLSRLEAKYILLNAPVGSGKSDIGVAAARGAESAFIVTPQNILLEQYARDFPSMPMVKGRSHYRCSWAGGGMTCDMASETYGNQHTKHCHDYIPARDMFWASRISVINVHYAMLAQCPDGFGRWRKLLVVDECHGLEEVLLELFHLHVYQKDAGSIGIRFDTSDVQELFDSFVRQDKALSDEQLGALVPDISQRERIRGTARRLAQMNLRDLKNPWNVHCDGDCIECRPLFARNLAPRLLCMAGQVLFMSGTPGSPDNFFRNLGIEPGKDTAVVTVDSDFPVGEGVRLIKNAPYVKTATLDTDMPTLADASAQILRQLPTEKGLILCASYPLAAKLVEALRPEFGSRLLTHNSQTREKAIGQHRRLRGPTVLIAVNMHEGLDLADDLGRFLIIPKVLYPARDQWVLQRESFDPGYYGRLTAARMVQACGRVVRGADDWAHICILDSNFLRLMERYPEEFPAYFRRGFRVE